MTKTIKSYICFLNRKIPHHFCSFVWNKSFKQDWKSFESQRLSKMTIIIDWLYFHMQLIIQRLNWRQQKHSDDNDNKFLYLEAAPPYK